MCDETGMNLDIRIFAFWGVMKLRNFLDKFFSQQKGSVAVVVALSLVVLLGFSALVVDFGSVHNQKSKLQNALDSAVLSAAQELPAGNTSSVKWIEAQNQAITYAAANNYEISADDIEPVYKDNQMTNKIIGIKVTKSIGVDYYFAKVMGFDSATVSGIAAAGVTPAGGVTGAVPLSITDSSLRAAINAGATDNLTIKCSSNANDIGIDNSTASGWFGALDFGSGASDYTLYIANGYSGSIQVGQILDMENGNMSGPTLDGFTTRYNKCADGCTADNFTDDCPRIVYVPVVQVISNSQVKVVSFAAFYLLECGGNGKNSYIKAKYIPGKVIPNSATGAGGEDFGLYTSRLLE